MKIKISSKIKNKKVALFLVSFISLLIFNAIGFIVMKVFSFFDTLVFGSEFILIRPFDYIVVIVINIIVSYYYLNIPFDEDGFDEK